MELRHLRYFVAVAAHGSFSRAAKALHLTQPALSRQVKDLEEELGVPLLLRGKLATTLTEAGERFADHARDLLARAEQSVQSVRQDHGTQVLRVGYAPSMTAGILSGALHRFQALEPRVKVELADLSSREMMDWAKDGNLDVLITPEPTISESLRFQWTNLRLVTPSLVMHQSHPLAKLKRVSPAQLRELPLIGLGRENYPEYVRVVRAMLKPFCVTPRFVALVNDGISTVFPEIEAHRAAAILPDGVASILPRTLVARPFRPSLPKVWAKIGVPEDRHCAPAQAFARVMHEEVRRFEATRKSAKAPIAPRRRRSKPSS